jgi:hypothetical protein
LEEVESTGRDKILGSGSGNPGWNAECNTILGKIKDECTVEATTTGLSDASTGVEVRFDSKSAHYNCSIGGAGAGVVTGTDLAQGTGEALLAAKAEGEDDCTGGVCSSNRVTVSNHLVQFIHMLTGVEWLTYTNKNWFDSWWPLFVSMNVVSGSGLVWGIGPGCQAFGATPARGMCQIEVTFTANGPGRQIAEILPDGAPSTATVTLEGEE